MHFRVLRSAFLSALNKVSRAVSAKSPLPALTGIKITAQKDQLIFLASNSDIAIETVLKGEEDVLKVEDTGEIVLSGHYISEIIRKMDSEYVTVEIIDGTLTRISGNHSDFKLNGTRANDYPKIAMNESGQKMVMDGFVLKDLINQTVFACGTSEARPYLTGLNMQAANGELTCVATDSYRLAKKVLSVSKDLSFNITVPAKSLTELSRMIEKPEDVTLYIGARTLLVVFADNKLQTRLVDGAFPDTRHLIPTTFLHVLNADSTEILNAVDRASLLSSDENNIVKLSMTTGNTHVYSNSQEIGSVNEDLINCEFSGEPLNISFSSRYVSEALRALNGTRAIFNFNGDMKPILITNPEDQSLLQLVLPVRTY